MVQVIVGYDTVSEAAEARAIRGLRGQTRRSFRGLKMRTVRIPARMLERLAERPGVRFVAMDAPVHSLSAVARATANAPFSSGGTFVTKTW